MKKICLMAAAGPSLVIKWNTSLRIRSLLHHLLINLLPLILLFLFPPVAARLCPLYLDVFFFFFLPPCIQYLTPPSLTRFFLPVLLQFFLQWATVIVHFATPCFPASLPACLRSQERRRLQRRRYRQRQRKEPQTNTHKQQDNDQDAQADSDRNTVWKKKQKEDEDRVCASTVMKISWFSW